MYRFFGMDWSVDEPWATKLSRLNEHIVSLKSENTSITLIGESAGASAVTQALASNPHLIDGVVCCVASHNTQNCSEIVSRGLTLH